jgi:hypothetical protein
LAVVGVAGAIVLVAMLVVISRWPVNRPETSPTGVESGPVTTAPQSADSPQTVEPAPAPTWVGRRRATWARDGSKTITFELEAINDVPVWTTRVRPRLVVRCLSRSTEVFVATGSSASIEPQAGRHTVRLQIDNDPEVLQQWSDSESQQELFAPNGLTLARRLARARRMRFGFTPYNATPVTADFNVQGFDQLAGLVASTCGWRLDGSPAAKAQRVSLK